MTSRRKTRELAFIALYQIEVGRHEPETLIADTIARESIDPDSRTFFRALVRNAWSEHELMDALIDQVASGWRVERLAKVELSILRMGAYELTHEVAGERGDPAVVINEAVVYAKRYAGEESGKFINGILGKIAAMPMPLNVAKEALDRPKPEVERKPLVPTLKGAEQKPGVRPVSGGPVPLKGEAPAQLPSGPELPEPPRSRRPMGRPGGNKFQTIRRGGPPDRRGPGGGGGGYQGRRPDEYRPDDRRDDRPRPYEPPVHFDAAPSQSMPELPGPDLLDRTTQADAPPMPPEVHEPSPREEEPS